MMAPRLAFRALIVTRSSLGSSGRRPHCGDKRILVPHASSPRSGREMAVQAS
jgi:hypothetical protein